MLSKKQIRHWLNCTDAKADLRLFVIHIICKSAIAFAQSDHSGLYTMALWVAKDPKILHADSQDSDQPG